MADLSDMPTAVIARLDAALARRGQSVVHRRYTAPNVVPRVATNTTMTGFVRALRAEEIIEPAYVTYSDVVLSPTGFTAVWPIVRGDKIVIDGKERNVEVVKPIRMAGTLVRCELVVAG